MFDPQTAGTSTRVSSLWPVFSVLPSHLLDRLFDVGCPSGLGEEMTLVSRPNLVKSQSSWGEETSFWGGGERGGQWAWLVKLGMGCKNDPQRGTKIMDLFVNS